VSENAHGWTTAQVVELLRGVDLLAGLGEDDLASIAAIVEKRSLQAGETLFVAGGSGSAAWIVVDGSVELVRSRPDGDEEQHAVLTAGQAFGDSALLTDAPRPETARSPEGATVARLSRGDLEDLLGGESVALRMIRSLAGATGADEAPTDRRRSCSWEVSRAMQAGLLPRMAPRLEGYETAAGTTREETGRGASVWDWIALADGRTALLTLDVRQDGFPAAHHIGMARAVLRALASAHATVPELLAKANDALSAAAAEGVDQYVEVGVLAVSQDAVEWASAGRVPGGIIRRDGAFEEFGAHGPPLGMMDGFKYTAQRLPVATGDAVFVLSHGSQGLFKGAADLVAQLQGKPAGEVVTTLHAAIRRVQGERRTETSVLYARRH
jgi:CRP-like cAMP-binding protein